MRPPIPPEENPKGHHERVGEPPANWPEDPQEQEARSLDELYELEEAGRSEDLYDRKQEPLKNPHRVG